MTHAPTSSDFEDLQVTLQKLSRLPVPAEAYPLIQLAAQQTQALSEATSSRITALTDAASQASGARSRFISAVTHELRLPLTAVKGYTDLLRQGTVGPVNDQQRNFLNVIRNNTERMSALISDLADISHIESGRIRLSLAPVSLASTVQEMLVSLKTRLDEKGQVFSQIIPTDLPDLYADRSRLVQILTIFGNNASQYNHPAGQITLRAQSQDDMVRVELADNGIGISAADQQHLYTQFFRSEDPAVREQHGWGLGLSLAKLLVDAMGGVVGASSELGKGSSFWFSLPAATRQA